MSFLMSDAFAAQTAHAAGQEGGAGSLVMIVVFMMLVYFLIWWPQSKRLKQHRNLINQLAKDDEIITSGGILGRISKISENFVVLDIADNVTVSLQKSAVSAVVPKGTFKTGLSLN